MSGINRDNLNLAGSYKQITQLQEKAEIANTIKYILVNDNKIGTANLNFHNEQGIGFSTINIENGTINNIKEVRKTFHVGLVKSERSFTGRTKELECLKKLLEGAGKCVVITGLGGIGKTELTRKYAEENILRYCGNIAWIPSETSAEIKTGFHDLADKLNIKVKIGNNERNIINIISDVYKHIQAHIDTGLIIFDNVVTMGDIGPYLPWNHVDNYQLNVLLTSQNTEFSKISCLELDVLSDEDAMNFVKNELENAEDIDEMAKELVDKLQNLPLALQQAVAYINDKIEYGGPYTIRNYLNEFDKVFGKQRKFPETVINKYNKTVYVSVELTLNKIKSGSHIGKLAVELLYVMAFLSSDDIQQDMLLELRNDEGKLQLQEVSEALRQIRKFSLIAKKYDSNKTKYVIHRLVQNVLKSICKDEGVDGYILHKALHISFRDYSPSIFVDVSIHLRSVLTNIKSDQIIVNYFQNLSRREKSQLFCALIRVRHLNALKCIIKEHRTPDVINRRNPQGITPLKLAAWEGYTEIVHWLIENKAKVNSKNIFNGHALNWAALRGHTDTLECLIKHNADVNRKGLTGETALHWAAVHGHTDAVKCLIKHKADVNITDGSGQTALHRAAGRGQFNTVRQLLVSGANVHIRTNESKTALQIASERTNTIPPWMRQSDYSQTMKVLEEYVQDDSKENCQRNIRNENTDIGLEGTKSVRDSIEKNSRKSIQENKEENRMKNKQVRKKKHIQEHSMNNSQESVSTCIYRNKIECNMI